MSNKFAVLGKIKSRVKHSASSLHFPIFLLLLQNRKTSESGKMNHRPKQPMMH